MNTHTIANLSDTITMHMRITTIAIINIIRIVGVMRSIISTTLVMNNNSTIALIAIDTILIMLS